MLTDFAAIDFETANGNRSSICSVGVVIVHNGLITDSFYSLVQPEPNYYSWFCQKVHGLGHKDTDNAEVFPKVWAKIEPLLALPPKDSDEQHSWLPLVAHNKQFDEGCLRAVMQVYRMDWPGYEFHCTLQASRRKLPNLENHQLHTVCAACGYDLAHHHHALADAEACAEIAIRLGI